MAKCPDCGTGLEWGYCETCDKEIPEGQEIATDATASHPWIVRDQPVYTPPTEEEMKALLEAKFGKATVYGKDDPINPEDFKIYAETDYG